MKDGTKANHRGRKFEDQCAQICVGRGLQIKRQRPIAKSMYGHVLKVDIVAYGIPSYEEGIIIEAKWQGSPGSADEKYPYLVGNIKGNYGGASGYPLPTIVVYGGPGARDYANRWLRRQVGGKLIKVFTLEELMHWLNCFDDAINPVPELYQRTLNF